MNHHEQRGDLLETYFATLRYDLTAAPLPELDPEMSELASTLTRVLLPPDPEPAFAERLRARLDAEAAALVSSPVPREAQPVVYRNGSLPAASPRLEVVERPPADGRPVRALKPAGSVRRWLPLSRFATAAAVLLALVGIFAWSGNPRSVDALEIVQRAREVDRSPARAVSSFEMTTRITSRPGFGGFRVPAGEGDVVFQGGPVLGMGTEPVQMELRQWFAAPDHIRVETSAVSAEGRREAVLVSNGRETWSYQTGEGAVLYGSVASAPTPFGKSAGVVRFVAAPAAGPFPFLPLDGEPGCPLPRLHEGAKKVAGRAAYLITMEMNGPACEEALAPPGIEKMELWVDRETYFVLKTVDYGSDGQPLLSTEVTSVRFNLPLPPERFNFTPPPGIPIQEGWIPGVPFRPQDERRSVPAPPRFIVTPTATGPPFDPAR